MLLRYQFLLSLRISPVLFASEGAILVPRELIHFSAHPGKEDPYRVLFLRYKLAGKWESAKFSGSPPIFSQALQNPSIILYFWYEPIRLL